MAAANVLVDFLSNLTFENLDDNTLKTVIDEIDLLIIDLEGMDIDKDICMDIDMDINMDIDMEGKSYIFLF